MHVFCTIFLLASPLYAQEPPDAPKPGIKHFNRRVFVAVISLLAASKTAAAITTRQLLDRGGRELNPVFEQHPLPATQAGTNAGIFAAPSAAFYLTEHSRHKWIRWTGIARAYGDPAFASFRL